MRYAGLSLIVLVLLWSSDRCTLPDSGKAHTSQKQDSLITVSISVVGDIMCHSVQYNYAKVAADSFDFNPVFSEIKKYLDQSDFVFGNLETVTAGERKGYSGYPFFNSPDDFIAALKNAGFDLLTTANNHAIDRGEAGVRRTIEQLELNHLNYNGTFLSEKDRDSIRIFDIKGIKVAFLAYTYGTNGIPIPKGKEYLVNLIDTVKIKNDIRNAKVKGADAVLVHFHFGDEYQRLPNSYQKEIVRKTILAGADIIIGGHTHVLQPIEFFKTNNARLDTGFVIYSMGNFISNQRWRFSDGGAILTFSLTKDISRDSIFLNDVDYLPIWVFKGMTRSGKQYIIIPSEAAFSDSLYYFLTPEDKIPAAQSFHDTNEILRKYSKKPKLRDILQDILSRMDHLSFH
jgi:poly-gamma-glutamate capsule biosynthesis protein CapA/YwtB (metallophosphatase superfamily)